MRRFFLWSAAGVVLLVALASLVLAAVHAAGLTDGLTLSVDGETFDGPVVAVMLGGFGVFTAVVVVVTTLATIASLAIVVPVLLALVGVFVMGLLIVGLSPLLVPVLLVGGACALLFRRPRPAPALPSTGPSAPLS